MASGRGPHGGDPRPEHSAEHDPRLRQQQLEADLALAQLSLMDRIGPQAELGKRRLGHETVDILLRGHVEGREPVADDAPRDEEQA